MDRLKTLPKSSILWFLSYIEKTHSTPPSTPGDEVVIELVTELRTALTTTNEDDKFLQRESSRWIETKQQMREIMGEAIFTAVTQATDGSHDNIVTSAHLMYTALVKAGDTQPEFMEYRARMRHHAAMAALLPNIRSIAHEMRHKLKEVSQSTENNSYWSHLYRGEIALAQAGEDLALKLSEYVGQKGLKVTGEADDAWRAVVRYRADGKPKSAAQIALLMKDCFPVVCDKTLEIRTMLEGDGSDAWAKWMLHQLAIVGSDERLDTIVKSLAAVSPETIKQLGSDESNGQLKKSFEHELKSNAVSLMLRLLPHVQFPPIEGERDGVNFVVRNLSLSQLHVDEKHIRFTVNHTLGQLRRGDPVLKIMVDDVSATLQGMSWEFKQTHFPYLSGSGLCDAQVGGVGVVLGFQIIKRTRTKAAAEVGGDGKSSSSSKQSATPDQLVPQLVLGVTRVFIDHVKLDLKDSIYMTLADMFSKSIRIYLTSLVEDRIVDVVTDVLDNFNQKLAKQGWDVLDAAFDWNLDPIPTEEVAAKRATQLDAPVTARKDSYSVSFPHDGSLGIMLSKQHEFVVVKGFKTGPKGEVLPGEASGKIKIGDVLVGFNGGEITSLPLDRVMARLSRSRRPLTLTFHPGEGGSSNATNTTTTQEKPIHVQEFKFMDEKLHLILKARPLEDRGAVVTGFRDPPEGGQGPAAKAGVPVGWIIAEVNKQDTLRKTFKETTALLAVPQRPITLKFVRDCDYVVDLKEKPTDLKIASFSVNNKKLVIVSALENLVSPAEIALKDKIETGDFVSAVNGKDTCQSKFDDVISLIRAASKTPPVELTFSRFGVGTGNNMAVVAKTLLAGPSLGLVFYKSSTDGKCCWKAFQGIPGPIGMCKMVQAGHVLLKVGDAIVTDEEMARSTLEKKEPPYSLQFRDMDAFAAGGWGKGA